MAMYGLTIIFISVAAAGNGGGPEMIPLYADESVSETEAKEWLKRLDAEAQFSFKLMSEAQAREYVAEGDVSQAVKLFETDYVILVGRDDPVRIALHSLLRRVYSEELRLENAAQSTPDIREQLAETISNPALAVSVSALQEEKASSQSNDELQLLFGMTLFFVVYTIMFSLVRIVGEKETGTWNRMVISPISKWQMYFGHLSYSFLIGFSQITLIFLLFRFAFGFEMGGDFWLLIVIAACYTFSIVALGLLIISLVSQPRQLGAIIPIIATGMAMIGGAFWPIELVTNEILLTIAKILPITYGIQALTSVAVYGDGLKAVIVPILLLLGFGGIFTSLGIRLLEWRSPQP